MEWFFDYKGSLFTAVQREDETKIQQLLKKGMNINVKDRHGRTPLHRAVSSGDGAIAVEKEGESQRDG